MNIKRKLKQNIIIDNNDSTVPLLQFPILKNTGLVEHGFTTRAGGVSENEFSTLNLSFTRGDKPEAVEENFKRTAKAFNRKYEDFVFTDQTHTTNIRVVTKEDRGKGLSRERDYSDIDGIITKDAGIILSAFFADCVPVFLLDPVKKVIGMVHSGWKGTTGRISANAVSIMEKEFGCKASDILAAIGPSICHDCYEVSEDVKIEFDKNFSDEQIEKIFDKKNDGKYLLDLWLANKMILKDAGLQEKNIQVTDICTCCNHDILFSHRASHGRRGNLGGFISLN